MSSYRGQQQQQQQLTADERTICEYFADQECARCRPRNHAAYRATVLARKISEILDARRAGVALAAIVAVHPDDRWIDIPQPSFEATRSEPCAPPDVARAVMASAIAAGRIERAELLAQLERERSTSARW